MFSFLSPPVATILFLGGILPGLEVASSAQESGDAALGKTIFQQNCAICHADSVGPDNAEIVKQGPSLVGILGRRAGASATFNYSEAMRHSGLTWDAPSLDRFLAAPGTVVPGTTMPINVPSATDRRNVIAYLSTLKMPADPAPAAGPSPSPSPPAQTNAGNWQQDAPGLRHRLSAADLPAPYATRSSGNGPKVIKPPVDAKLSVPPGFTVKLFASGLSNPRIVRVAPNGDIFIAETGANRIRVLRASAGADAPSDNRIFAEGLDRPFGIAFYPPGNSPQWIYVANNNSVVRFPYHNGDLQVHEGSQVIVPRLTESHGGHSTRDIAFSLDGKRLFISVGSGSNVAEDMSKKSPEDIIRWETEHGFGAAWDAETNRADILTTDPEGHRPLSAFATGIRNGVGLAVNPETGDLWSSANERDGLGDDLVPDYVTRVKEGGFYGWPWYYLGNHEDPRLAGVRPDLAGKALVPDVLLQAHSASLEMCFYTATGGAALFPAEYRGDAFAAEHGSWNRSTRTGYKLVHIRLHHGRPIGEYDDFLTGFVVDNENVWGRPVGVAVARDGALFMTEDGNGTLWRIAYDGEIAKKSE